MCLSNQLAFESKRIVFHKQNWMNTILKIEVLIIGKRTSGNPYRLRRTCTDNSRHFDWIFDYITNWKRDLHKSFDNARGSRIQSECWNFVYLNSRKFESVEQWMEIMRSFGQLVVLHCMLNSPVNNKDCCWSTDKRLSKNPWKEEKCFKNMIAL